MPTDEPRPHDSARLNGAVIRFAMRIRGLSQNRLAAEIGINESTLSRALRGETTTWRVVRRIMEVFEQRLNIAEVVILPEITPAMPPGVLDIDP